MAARWGGDEFTILAPSTLPAAGASLAERIRSRIAEQIEPFPLTASIGVATHVHDEDGIPGDPASIMRAADDAMYQAKRYGKNTVFVPQRPSILRYDGAFSSPGICRRSFIAAQTPSPG
ncbi:MAG TPA: GGDEF domain-containing protein [Vicinamibacterales bacterium]|nr:GGDEF domain-containing protein [Vicinamibacterales bacterium]